MRALAEAKLADASLLLDHQRYSSAYYLAGYAVELALKACVSRQFRENEIPAKELIKKVLTHDFQQLVALAGLTAELKAEQSGDGMFGAYWGVVNEWESDSRYDMLEAISSQQLIRAIADEQHGVMRWIRLHW